MPIETIEDYANHLQVPFLVHFTQAQNLPSILEHGIIPVAYRDNFVLQPTVNDPERHDGYPNATCTSIAFPNYRMFYHLRMAIANSEWAVLSLDRSILWAKCCAFCRHNAADARISAQPLEDLMTLAAFQGMYDPIVGDVSRLEQRLRPFDPTDVQAEVLVFGVIEPELIRGMAFDSQQVRTKYHHLALDMDVRVFFPGAGPFAQRGSPYAAGI
jgi:hypothetical protein